jgi:N-acetylneuraminic acid mutarotase
MLSSTKSRHAGKTLLHTFFFFLLLTQICFGQGTWTKIGDMPEIRYAHTADEISGKVYIAGGVNTEQGAYPTTMLVYDEADSSWTTISLPGNSLRGQHTSCVVDHIVTAFNLYLIGGGILVGGTVNSTAQVDIYNITTGQWYTTNPMPTDRLNLACALLDDKIYVAGGMHCINGVQDYNGLKTFEVYNLSTQTWSTLPDMPTRRWGLSAVAFDGKIYVFGGRTLDFRPPSIDVYDPQDSTWNIKSNMPTPRYQLATCLLDSNIYAIDGWYSSGSGPIYDTVEVYNPITDVWTTGTSMPVAVAMLDGYALNDKIYMYGGSYTTHPNIGISDIWEFTPPLVAVETEVDAPLKFALEQNFPNPFNPSTKIKYSVPQSSNVVIKVFDILGIEIETLVSEEKPAGTYEITWYAENFPSGVYFYQLKAGEYVNTKKMILIK